MAEINFFMTDKEGVEFASFLISQFSAEFVPEKSLQPPPFPRYKEVAQVRRHIEQNDYYSRFFVLSAQWERYPLEFLEINANDGSHFFTVSQRHGGPAFDFILSRTIQRDGVRWILPGSFSDYPYYIRDRSYLMDDSRYEIFDRPEAMRYAYKEVQKYLRRNGCRSVCREHGGTGPWVLSGAASEFNSGTWLRRGKCHFEPKAKNSKPTSGSRRA